MKIIDRIREKLGIKRLTYIEILRGRGVKIGENVDLINTYIDGGFGFLCEIGDNTTLTGVTVLTHDASTKKKLGYSKIGRVIIGNNVFIGHGSIILPNVKIGDNVIIGAGTIVAKDVPNNVVIAGNPWRVINSFDDYIEKHRNNLHSNKVYNKYWKDLSIEEKDALYKKLNKNKEFNYIL